MNTTSASTYELIFDQWADERVKSWPLMSDAGPLVFIITVYLMLVKWLLPEYMKQRKAYNLKRIIFVYNVGQILTCCAIIYGILTSGWSNNYIFNCKRTDYSYDPKALRMVTMIYYTLILKIIELSETTFFVLRKKFNQVSALHVYHHVSTLCIAWISCKYIGGGMIAFHIMLNCSIHIVMYTYYLLSALGAPWQERLTKLKPKITILQMLQFCIMLAHSASSFRSDCDFPKAMSFMYTPNIIIIFYLFWKFYKQAYADGKSPKRSE